MRKRRVLVVGASSGIGAAVAKAADAAGAVVTIAARRRPELEALVAEMQNAHAAVGDAADPIAAHHITAAAAAQVRPHRTPADPAAQPSLNNLPSSA